MAPGSVGRVEASQLMPGFEPETELERRLAGDPEMLRGLAWGEPRAGHPEGPVGTHVSHLLEALERSGESGERRELLRVGENHHAMRARRFAEKLIDDERVLATIQLHDRPYALWRKMHRRGKVD